MLQAFILIPYILRAARFHQSGGDVVKRLLQCILHAAPPGIPTVLLIISFANISRLGRKGIRLTFPQALRPCAAATVACFDKTGTLTGTMVRTLKLMLVCYCPRLIVVPAPDEASISFLASAC